MIYYAQMKREKHLQKAKEIEASLQKLLPDPEGKNVVAVVELTYGICQHLIAAGCEKKFGEHLDTHVGLPKFLRKRGAERIAKIFEDIDEYRMGRWYGGRGNGRVVKDCLSILKEVKKWSKKNE